MKEILGVKLYNVNETAELLGLTVYSLRIYIKERKIKGRKIGNAWYFAEENIKAFVLGEEDKQKVKR